MINESKREPDADRLPDSTDPSGCNQVTVVVEEEWVGERRAADKGKNGRTISWRGIHGLRGLRQAGRLAQAFALSVTVAAAEDSVRCGQSDGHPSTSSGVFA